MKVCLFRYLVFIKFLSRVVVELFVGIDFGGKELVLFLCMCLVMVWFEKGEKDIVYLFLEFYN